MDDKDIIIALLRQQLFSQVHITEKVIAESRLLWERIARLEKNSSNSSKPPSSDIINPKPPTNGRSKRKIDAQSRHPKHSRIAVDADKTIIHKLSDREVNAEVLLNCLRANPLCSRLICPKRYSI